MREQPLEVVRLKIEQKMGNYYVSSDDMPGLWLWGPDPDIVFHDVPIAVRELYMHRRGIDVVVRGKSVDVKIIEKQLGVEKITDIYEIYPVSAIENQDEMNGR